MMAFLFLDIKFVSNSLNHEEIHNRRTGDHYHVLVVGKLLSQSRSGPKSPDYDQPAGKSVGQKDQFGVGESHNNSLLGHFS